MSEKNEALVETRYKMSEELYKKLVIKLVAEDSMNKISVLKNPTEVIRKIDADYSDKFKLPSPKSCWKYIHEVLGEKDTDKHNIWMETLVEVCRLNYKMTLLFELGIRRTIYTRKKLCPTATIFTESNSEYLISKVFDEYFNEYFEGFICGKNCILVYFKSEEKLDDFLNDYRETFKIHDE